MREAIHTASGLNVDVAIFGDFGCKAILLDAIVGKVAKFDAQVFTSGHRSVKVEVFDIDGHEIGAGGGDHAVEE